MLAAIMVVAIFLRTDSVMSSQAGRANNNGLTGFSLGSSDYIIEVLSKLSPGSLVNGCSVVVNHRFLIK